jgi:hypothetical protein
MKKVILLILALICLTSCAVPRTIECQIDFDDYNAKGV